MFDSIISGIKKIKKNHDLKGLKDRRYLSIDEFSIMKDLVMYGSGESVEFEYFERGTFSSLENSLNDYWEGNTDSKDYFAEKHTSVKLDSAEMLITASRGGPSPSESFSYSKDDPHIAYKYITEPKPPEPWGFKITDQFMRSINRIDKKLQGRILEAITKLSLSPTTSTGNTIKPLTGDLEGFWRYRIGNYRLIYKPVEKLREITLISFAARGSAYE